MQWDAYFFRKQGGCDMGVRVAVAGASGYAGGELLRLLAGHPDLEIGAVTAGASVGKPVTSVHPNLTGHPAFVGREFGATGASALGDAELIFMALPHGESAALAKQLPGVRIVDLSADFRLDDPRAWDRFYGIPYAGRWAYGLPELPGARAKIKAARTVAAPGCYATASILALAPLLAAGLADPGDIVIVAASGTSGAGRSPRPDLLASEVMGSMSAYKVGGAHRHTPEIEQALAEVGESYPERSRPTAQPAISFTPVLAPMPRGILAVCTARLAPGIVAGLGAGWNGAARQGVTADGPDADNALRGAFADAYAGSPFVHLLPAGQWPVSAAVSGSNGAHLQVTADTRAGRAVVVSAIDNLGKGAAGQAVQIANLMLGLPETAGLTTHGVAP
jgi:N-acetyl-gamma-glutamyl-phosphate reductase